MRVFFGVMLAVACIAAAPDVRGQCPGPRCPKPQPATQPARYEWRQDEDEPHWFGLYQGGVQVAAYNAKTQRIYLLDPSTDKWVETFPQTVQQLGAEGGTEPISNGVVRGMIKPEGERFSINGRDVEPRKGRGVFGPSLDVPDDARWPSLTFIGPEDLTSAARQKLEGDPRTREIMKRLLVQEFKPDNPLVSKAGFKTDGKPTIYAEMPNGQVLWRVDQLPEIETMVAGLRYAVDTAEGIRKPDAANDPARDPGIVLPLKPQVNATVSPSPWQMVFSHAASFLVGLLGGAGGAVGGGALIRRLISAAIQAELAGLAAANKPAGDSGAKSQ